MFRHRANAIKGSKYIGPRKREQLKFMQEKQGRDPGTLNQRKSTNGGKEGFLNGILKRDMVDDPSQQCQLDTPDFDDLAAGDAIHVSNDRCRTRRSTIPDRPRITDHVDSNRVDAMDP